MRKPTGALQLAARVGQNSISHPESITLTNERRVNGEAAVGAEAGYVNIGSNLASALRALRQPSDKRILWCDSVCIDQKDFSERSTQVDNMHWIYHYARSVIIWLSPETTWSIMAMFPWLKITDNTATPISTQHIPGDWSRIPSRVFESGGVSWE
jgi:hypothetical protein